MRSYLAADSERGAHLPDVAQPLERLWERAEVGVARQRLLLPEVKDAASGKRPLENSSKGLAAGVRGRPRSAAGAWGMSWGLAEFAYV